MPYSTSIGNRIRKARKQKGLSQQELGKLVGVWGTHIGQIEKGDRNPSEELCIKLARKLDLDVLGTVVGTYKAKAESKLSRDMFSRIEDFIADPELNNLLRNKTSLDGTKEISKVPDGQSCDYSELTKLLTQLPKPQFKAVKDLIQIMSISCLETESLPPT
tara:strand:- start:43 stop:525 length:483 start_codon:yes stop_codon:yes gene_type:complete